eukprot:scaffold93301_cov36-Phaeocystis_antarctica.AAC.1
MLSARRRVATACVRRRRRWRRRRAVRGRDRRQRCFNTYCGHTYCGYTLLWLEAYRGCTHRGLTYCGSTYTYDGGGGLAIGGASMALVLFVAPNPPSPPRHRYLDITFYRYVDITPPGAAEAAGRICGARDSHPARRRPPAARGGGGEYS